MSTGPCKAVPGSTLDTGLDLSDFQIRIHNRHISCIEETQTPIVPISHAWHEGVARANVTKQLNEDAIYEAFFRPLSILKAATPRFTEVLNGPVEIWHDYFSIPQFLPAMQERILLALPDIFRVAPFCLIHLGDVSAATIRAMFPRLGGADDHVQGQLRRLSCIDAFQNSRWFKHMWVNLEYAFCQRACVLTSDDRILYWGGSGQTRDSFSLFRLHARLEKREVDMQMALLLPPEAHREYQRISAKNSSGLAVYARLGVNGGGKHLTYGEALEQISMLDCREYRDRFLAMAGILSIGSYRDIALQISPDTVQACLWVAKGCLQRGDHSPLLLTPCGEAPARGARWLVGHEKMTPTMCFLGERTHQPKNTNILDEDGNIHEI